jgi:dTDP-4-amino-4,6-dideoxygalactose transaminase
MRVPFVDLQAQFKSLEPEVMPAIHDVLSRCNFILGDAVEKFEQDFAVFTETKYAIGVSSGVDALRLALNALDVGVDDEVILPANTFIATALAVSAVGARPVLVDCDRETYNIDVTKIEAAITRRTRVIMPVHLTGQAADMDPILDIAARHKLHVVEDSAQAAGSHYKGRPCGSMGIISGFSLYPGKNLGAYGDGGMITTNDALLAERLRQLRNYGQKIKYVHVEKGLNARLDTLQAAVVNVKLPHLNAWNEARAAHAEKYREQLQGVGDIVFQHCLPASGHIYHLFMIETDHRAELQKHLAAIGVDTGIHYPIPVHLQPAYAELNYKEGAFPNTEYLANRILSLPMYAELTDAQIEHVTNGIHDFFEQRAASSIEPERVEYFSAV